MNASVRSYSPSSTVIVPHICTRLLGKAGQGDPDRLTPLIGCLGGHFGASFDGAPGVSRSGRLTYKDGKTVKWMQRKRQFPYCPGPLGRGLFV